MPPRCRAALAVLALLALAGCAGRSPAETTAPPRRPLPGFDETAFTVTAADGHPHRGCALLADDPASRQQGLTGRRDLGGYDAMIFAFEEAVDTAFWMRDTPLPLSIAFFAPDGRFVSATDMAPCPDSPDCPRYRAAAPYAWAVEVPRGDLGRLGLGPGARLVVGGSC